MSSNALRGPAARVLILLAISACIPACGGSGGVGPPSPLAATIPPSSGNVANVVNASNASAVFVDVSVDTSSSAVSYVEVTVQGPAPAGGGEPPEVSATGAAQAGAAVVTVGPIDVSSLPDGVLTVLARAVGSGGSSASVQLSTVVKDTVAPAVAASLGIVPSGGPTANAIPMADVVNLANVGSVTVDVDFQSVDATDVAVVSLSDGVTTVNGDPFTPPGPAGATTVTGLDATALIEGPIEVRLTVTDPQGNAAQVSGQAAWKDTVVDAAVAASVPAGTDNPSGVVNAATQSAVIIDVTVAPEILPSDQVRVDVTDGTATLSSEPQSLPGDSSSLTLQFDGLDLSTFQDGALAITAVITDSFGNIATTPGDPAAKDTQIGGVSSTAVAAGSQNAAGVINAASAGAVSFDVVLDAGANPGDQVTVTLDDGVGSVSASAVAVGPGSLTVGPLDTTGLADGTLGVAAVLSDDAGNASAPAIAQATKDTVAPTAPASVAIPVGPQNQAGYITAATQGSVSVSAVVGAGNDATRTLTVRLTDGATSVEQTVPAPTGGAPLSLGGFDASSFPDGSLDLRAWTEDGAGNVSPTTSVTVVKDTFIAPATAASVPAGAGNTSGFISVASQGAVTIQITLPAQSVGTDIVQPQLSDGVTMVAVSPQSAPAGGGVLTFAGIDASSLADGSVALVGTVADVAGNSVAFGPFPFVKDTIAPAPPLSLVVPVGPSNPASVINALTAPAVSVMVVYDASMDGSEVVVATLTAGASSASAPQNATNGGGAAVIPGIVATALAEGGVQVSMALTDVAGNVTTFAGTPALKDTVAPAMPTSATVVAGAGNAAGVINVASVSAVQVDVGFGPSSAGTDTARVDLVGGATTIASATLAAPSGSGTVSFGPLDATTLPDGPITVMVAVTDASLNTTTFGGTPAVKDTVTPDDPIFARVAAGPSNPVDFINSQSETSVAVEVSVPSSYAGTETVSVSLSDGANPPVASATQTAPAGGGLMTFAGLNAAALNDGPVSVSVSFQDAAANASSFSGTAATKDVTGPPGPTLLTITAVGGVNPADTINANIETSVPVDVGLDAAMVGDELVFVSLTDGVSTVSSSTVLAPPGGGLGTFLGLNCTGLLDGPVTLTMTLTDPAGNQTISNPVAVTKDTVAPSAPAAAHVKAGANPIDTINAASQGAVSVDVTFGSSSVAADGVTVTLSDGANPPVTVGSGSANAGAGTVTFGPADASGLNDGAISVQVVLQDSNLNSATYAGTAAVKDTAPPANPSFARVAAGASNPVNFINNQSEASVTVEVSLPGSYVGTETVSVSLSDGAIPTVASGNQTAPAGGGLMTFAGLNAAALNEGPVSVSVSLQDAAGNSSSFSGTSATKDVSGPPGPTLLRITAVGGVNPLNTINANIVSSVPVDVGLDGAMVGNETVFVSLSDGVSTVNSSTVLSPPGGGLGTFLGLNCTGLLEGPITLTMTLTDPAGNQTISSPVAVTKDTVAPSAPAAAHVKAGANPIDTISAASEGAVSVDVTFGSGSVASDGVTVTLSDGANPAVTVGSGSANAGAGTLTFGPADASGLNDGAISVQVVLQDSNLNSATYAGTAAVKDTVPPASPSLARVASGADNPVNFINNQSEASVTVEVTVPGSYAGTETVSVSLSDGANPPVASGTQTAPVGGGTMTFTGLNATALNEGPVSVTVSFQDPVGNSSTFNGTGATKDVTGPPGPTLLTITAVGGVNPANTINANIQNSVPVDVGLDGAMVGNEIIFVSLTDGVSTVNSSMVLSPPGGGLGTFLGLNCTGLLEGPITLTMTLTDPAGNETISSPVAVTKDTVPPPVPTAAVIAAGGGNNADWISAASVNAVQVDVTIPAGSIASDVLDLTLDDGSSTVTDSQTPPAGGGVVSFTGLMTSGLSDGSLMIRARVTDANLNTATYTGSGDKDVVMPVVPTGAVVAAGAQNPQDFINSLTEGAVIVEVTWGAGVDANDRCVADLGDGMATASSAPIAAPAAPGTAQSAGIDTTSLAEGAITITLNTSDLAGNTASSAMGTGATKDVTVPSTPLVDPVTSPTNVASQVVTGVSDGNDAIEITGGAALATGTALAGGTFSVTVMLAADSTNALSLVAKDAAANPSATVTLDRNGGALTIVHDSTAPDVPFTDVTTAAGVGDNGAIAGGAFADVDNDGDLDILVGGAGTLFLGDGAGVFSDVTGSLGVTLTADRSATFGDHDGDGDLDLFLTDSVAGGVLLRNDLVGMGSFGLTDVTGSTGAGIGTALRGAGWFDYDGDGLIDIVAADNDGSGNELLHNLGGTFAGVTGSGLSPMMVSDPSWLGLGDLDGDGDLDVIIGDTAPSQVWIGDGAGMFTDDAGVGNSGFDAGVESTGGGFVLADIDNDGDLDIFVCRGGASNENQLWLNDGAGGFTDKAVAAGVDGDVGAYDAVAGDFDHDGRIDFYLACSGQSNVLLLNQGDQVGADGVPEFTDVAAQTGCEVDDGGDGRLALAGDVDGDGDLDIYLGNHLTANVLFRNDLDDARYLKVRVVGKGGAAGGASVDAIGAVVKLTDETTMTDIAWRTVSGGRGAGAQDPAVLHFGGIVPSRPYTVTVALPTGGTVVVPSVVPILQTGQMITVIEP